ncbi:MAG: acetyl-CoA carboxylase carboxyltransferase subunit alpha [Verrucomicrobiae bacterium]|nr:acetyl-CoA carboxylase carboxyltransferase subunit alpha [Verrucomicrobiae bacterium]
MKTFPLEFERPLAEMERHIEEMRARAKANKLDLTGEIAVLERRLAAERRQIYSNLTAWQRVQISRHPRRPYFLDYAARLFTDFTELHGDRIHADDQALIGGFATFHDGKAPWRVMAIGQQKGHDTKENLLRNFGMAHPEGYRKALRLMRMADRFDLPILCFIDTPGAYPGVEAEERHVAEAIAVNLREMFSLRVPIVAAVIGEGGSGGALGIGVADRVLMLENAWYSVISPEGCAAILWKDRAHAPAAAEALCCSARDLLRAKLVDEIVPEPLGGAHHDVEGVARDLKMLLAKHLAALARQPISRLLESRYRRYRSIGVLQAPPTRRARARRGKTAASVSQR